MGKPLRHASEECKDFGHDPMLNQITQAHDGRLYVRCGRCGETGELQGNVVWPDGERQWKPKKVRIRFTPQAWIRDYATEVDPQGPREFEVPVRDAQNEQGEWLPDRSYESDILREHKNAPKWIRQWSGPFEIEILHSQGDAHA